MHWIQSGFLEYNFVQALPPYPGSPVAPKSSSREGPESERNQNFHNWHMIWMILLKHQATYYYLRTSYHKRYTQKPYPDTVFLVSHACTSVADVIGVPHVFHTALPSWTCSGI